MKGWTINAQSGNLKFHHLQTVDGLSETHNAFIYKDSRGLVWLSSITGLNRFDGVHIQTYYTNPEDPATFFYNNIQSPFYEDAFGNLWFSTFEALIRYDRSRDCFDNFQVPTSGPPKIRYYVFYKERDKKLWLLCEDEIYYFDMETAEFRFVCRVEPTIQRVIALPGINGSVSQIWTYKLGTSIIEKLILYQDTVFQKEIYKDHLEDRSRIRKMITMGDSVIWMLFAEKIRKYDAIHERIVDFNLGDKTAFTFELMDDSTFLVAVEKKGLWEWDLRQHIFKNHYGHIPDDDYSISSDQITYINRDRDGVIWTGSIGLGVDYTSPKKGKFQQYIFPQYGEESDYAAPISLIQHSPDSIWCSTVSNGSYWLIQKDNTTQVVPIRGLQEEDIKSTVVFALRDRLGHYWIGTHHGLWVLDPRNGKIKHVPPADQYMWGSQSPHGQLLFATNQFGLLTPRVPSEFNIELKRFIETDISTRYGVVWSDRKERIWLMEDYLRFKILDSSGLNVLKTIPINGMCASMASTNHDSLVWIVTTDGLYKIDAIKLELIKIFFQTLNNKRVGFTSMEIDQHQQIWLTTAGGILRMDKEGKNTRMYSQTDGLPEFQFSAASLRTTDGEIWFGSNGGITRFYPDRLQEIKTPAIPLITEIQVNDKTLDKKHTCEIDGSSNVTEIQQLTFNYSENTISFRIHALEYSAPQENKVHYQLLGIDDHELEAPSGTLIRYPNLHHGHYQLMMYAYNSDGIRNPTPRTLTLTITPPFYKTWWFIILMVLTGGSILAYIVYLRFSKKLELQNVRLKLYENLHDDVGSRLTAIVLSAEDLERNDHLNNPKIQSISQIAKSIVGNMRRLVWAIDPENDRMLNVMQKINHDKSILMGDRVALHIEMDPGLNNVVVPGEIRYQISSICNEALSNISKYAEASNVTIQVTQEHRRFNFTIIDDGKGFDPDSKLKNALTGSGYGLNNMKRRAARVNGQLEVFAAPGKGTRIEASFPY